MAPKKVGQASRIAILKDLVEQAERDKAPTFDVPFKGERKPFRRIRIDISFPLHRIQSGRTHRAQCEYLERHPHLPTDFFKDPEDPKVQKAQHQILLGMINERDLDQDLKDRGQYSPLVLSHDGFVVDGNRRLAALRDREEDYAEAVVLPPAQSHEIYETEIELQMQRETKAPYGWIDTALHIEYGINELGESVETVARRMRKSLADINRELEKLALVKAYLAWAGEKGKYHKVPNPSGGRSEQSFDDMVQRFSSSAIRRKSEKEKKLIRDACFAVIREESGYQDVRNVIKQFSQNASKIAERLRQHRPLMPPKKAPKPPADAGRKTAQDDPLRALANEAPEAAPEVDDLIDAVSDKSTTTLILEIVEGLEAEEKDAKRQQVPLNKVQHAISDLQQIDLREAEDLGAVSRALNALQKEIDRLVMALEKLHKKKK